MTQNNECYICDNETTIMTKCGHVICIDCLHDEFDEFEKNGCPVCGESVMNLLRYNIKLTRKFFEFFEIDIEDAPYHYCDSCFCYSHDFKGGCVDCDIYSHCKCAGLDNMYLFDMTHVSNYLMSIIKKKNIVIPIDINSSKIQDSFEGIKRDILYYKCCKMNLSELSFKVCKYCSDFTPHEKSHSSMCLGCSGYL